MSIWQAIFLGILQGFTEFLPVSSSGHLVLAQSYLGIGDGLLFDVMIHVATLIVILYFFRFQLMSLDFEDIKKIVIGAIPAALAGFFFQKYIESTFVAPMFVGMTLLITGTINITTNRYGFNQNTHQAPANQRKVFGIGLAQALALFPGISRSGTTVAAGVWQGIKTETAFMWSFLVAWPVILGAAGYQLLSAWKHTPEIIDWPILLIGMIAALISGLLGLKLFQKVVLHHHLEKFGWYCISLGSIVILWELFIS